MNVPSFPRVVLLIVASCMPAVGAASPTVLDIGSRLELFVDDYVIGELTGDAHCLVHKPEPREVVLVTDKPWEGNTCAYYTIFHDEDFQDGDRYRMYYRGSHYDTKTRKPAHREVACYAESRDGIHWTKPALGLFAFNGSKANNIVWDGIGTHCFTPFKDANPDCPADARYKAIARGRPRGKKGLYAFASPDGLKWRLLAPEPVITEGAFDSQNLAFWDPRRKCYVDFHRTFHEGRRDIMTCTSPDFLTWTKPVRLAYTGAPAEHLYTNAIQPYLRAPYVLLGFPTRYQPKNEQVEPTLMASRDGRTFRRWPEALIPITAPKDRDGNRSNYMAWGLVRLPGNDRELSVYASEAYYTGPDSRLRRFTFRTDGFVSIRASSAGGSLVTKPLRFAGDKLVINFSTEPQGVIRVELLKADGTPLKGYGAIDCEPLRGDEIEGRVTWKGGAALTALAGTPVRVRFHLKDADLYSLRFAQPSRESRQARQILETSGIKGGLVWVSHSEEPGRSFLWTPAPVVARGYDPRTGEVKRTVSVSHLVTPGHHLRCYPAKATERFLLLPKRGIEFVDLTAWPRAAVSVCCFRAMDELH